MSHARYDAYKDSGVEWLGAVPAHWNMQRLKDIKSSVANAFTDGPFGSNLKTEHFIDNGAVYVIDSGFITSGKFEKHREFKTISFEHFLTVKRSESLHEDIIISKIGANFGMSGILPKLDKPSLVSGNTLKLTINKKKVHLQFIHYHLLNLKVNGVFDLLVKGSAQPALSLGLLNSLTFPVPFPLREQQAIAAYLDTNTAQLDRKIELLGQKAAQYGKLKQSLINETVTRGLDKNVAMRDSGVEWIGDVPAHWEVMRVKEVFVESKSKSTTGDEMLLSVSEYTGVTQKKDNVGEDEFLSNAESLVGYKICKVGDLVINIMLAWKRGLGVSSFCGIVSPSYAVYSPLKKVNSSFFHYLLRTENAIAEFKRNSTGIIESRLRLYTDSFYALSVAVPPFDEQFAIAAYLDSKTAHIDRIVAAINNQIDKLWELRKTLINDIVTGKICILEQGGAGAFAQPAAERG